MKTVMRDGSHLVVPGDFLKTLENCQGYYSCPINSDGKLLGPVVGYTAEYEPGKQGVGLEYFNFSQADQWPAVLENFARGMYNLLVESDIGDRDPNLLIVGAPWAGVKFSQAVAFDVGCRHIFAEKKGTDLVLGRYEDAIYPGNKVVIGEELVNNASTTKKLIDLIEQAGGEVVAIMCAINRSFPFRNSFEIAPGRKPIPIISVIERSTPQLRQDDPTMAEAIAAGNVVWKPKYSWNYLKNAMDAQRRYFQQ